MKVKVKKSESEKVKVKRGLIGCLLYRRYGSTEATQVYRTYAWQQHVLKHIAATRCE